METVISVTQIIYYVAMSIAGPLALIAYLKVKETERLEKEYKTYDELDNRFFEYQKLALEYYDLDMLDVPNNDPSLAFDKKRKQEMVACSILFSLFERAYLMFSKQGDIFRKSQWTGWKRFLDDFIRRDNIRTAWQISKETYDTAFQAFMDAKIVALAVPSPAVLPKPSLEKLSIPLPVAELALSPNPPQGTLGAAAIKAAAMS
ncbi:MAG: hypothetical protein L0Y72_15565 [Gemmataceae bacterium]|nr:hypothetical protein [Gemmataceae bacterium]MCI0740464.1 hypothetical protein [Gemmataceae bacterium]